MYSVVVFFKSWKAKKEALVSGLRVKSALEQQDKTTRKWPAYKTAHSCIQPKNNKTLITRPIASLAYTVNIYRFIIGMP